MFEKIDMFVFWLGIGFNVIEIILSVYFSVFYGKINLNKIKNYGNIVFYTIIFFYTLNEKFFKIKNFLEYLVISLIIGETITFVLKYFTKPNNANETTITERLSFFIVVTFLICYLEGYLYQMFF